MLWEQVSNIIPLLNTPVSVSPKWGHSPASSLCSHPSQESDMGLKPLYNSHAHFSAASWLNNASAFLSGPESHLGLLIIFFCYFPSIYFSQNCSSVFFSLSGFWPFKEYRTYILTYIQSGSVVCVLMTGFRSCFYGSRNLRLMLDFHTSLFQEHIVQTPSAAVTLTLSAGFLHYKGHHFLFGNWFVFVEICSEITPMSCYSLNTTHPSLHLHW